MLVLTWVVESLTFPVIEEFLVSIGLGGSAWTSTASGQLVKASVCDALTVCFTSVFEIGSDEFLSGVTSSASWLSGDVVTVALLAAVTVALLAAVAVLVVVAVAVLVVVAEGSVSKAVVLFTTTEGCSWRFVVTVLTSVLGCSLFCIDADFGGLNVVSVKLSTF